MQKLKSTLLRVTKLLISMAYYVCSGARNVLCSLFGKKASGTCVAVHYHEVAAEHRKRFARQMDFLLRHTQPLAADHREPLQPGRRYTIVTFDDGLVSSIENAIPELVQRKIPTAFFVLPGLFGTVPQWAEFGPGSIGNESIATADRLKELPAGLITVGSHTMTHPWLPSRSDADVSRELCESRAELAKLLDREITLFSFPYGAFDDRLLRLCREAGYERAFTVVPVPALADPNEFVTGRIAVNPTDWALEFRLKILGAYRWMPTMMTWKRKLLGRPVQLHPKSSEINIPTRSPRYGID